MQFLSAIIRKDYSWEAVRKYLDTAGWVLKDKTEYDRLVDLCDDAHTTAS
jgi:hypothetical protein